MLFSKQYDITFSGLSFGEHRFVYDIDDTFFDNFSYEEILPVKLKATILLNKKNTFMELFLNIKGSITLTCDLTNESFKKSIDNSLNLIIKFSEFYNDDSDTILVLPHEAYQVNVAQYIYETVLLAIPLKKVHPGVEDGTLQSDVLEKLRDLEVRDHDYIDPRWDKLNDLLTKKKQENGTS